MKNVYMLLAFLLIITKSFAQDFQNANWIAGKNWGMSFLPNPNNPVGISGSAMDRQGSSASVSDAEGNLLFYTDGQTVYNKENEIMYNGNGILASTGGSVIIVPRPQYPNNYFIITYDGGSPYQNGMYYNEVNMTQDGNLGAVVVKNYVMRDHNSVNMNGGYFCTSNKLTATKHSNGVDYWIVAQVKDKIYSYLVSSTGINNTPVAYSTAPFNTWHSNTFGDYSNTYNGPIKISANGQRIASVYNSNDTPTQNYLALGYFNASNGYVSFDNDQISLAARIFGVEFSSNNEYVYFTGGNLAGSSSVYWTTSTSGIINSTALPQTNITKGSLQRAINNDIYISINVIIPGTITLYSPQFYVIKNSNNPSDLVVQVMNLLLPSSHTGRQFPQLVPFQYSSPCVTNLTIPIGNTYVADYRQATNSITSQTVVNDGANVIYHAGNAIVLTSGFRAVSGSRFHGYIEGCSNNFAARMGNFDQEDEREASSLTEPSKEETNFFNIAPNPANSIVSITTTEAMRSVIITSQDGKTLYSRAMPDKITSIDIPVGTYANGIYTVTVTTASGKMQTKKLVKN